MTIRVLLCDDQALVRSGFRMILEARPDLRVVGEAADGLRAVELSRRLAPDVILMDVRMPNLDGVAATRRLSEATVKTHVSSILRKLGLRDRPDQPVVVVVGEQARDQLAAAAHTDLGEQRLEVAAHRVGRQEQRPGDLVGAEPLAHQTQHVLLRPVSFQAATMTGAISAGRAGSMTTAARPSGPSGPDSMEPCTTSHWPARVRTRALGTPSSRPARAARARAATM